MSYMISFFNMYSYDRERERERDLTLRIFLTFLIFDLDRDRDRDRDGDRWRLWDVRDWDLDALVIDILLLTTFSICCKDIL